MEPWIQMVVTIVCSMLASGGFWAWIAARREKKDAKTSMILGLGHDRIVFLCEKYLDRGYINSDEYENLNKYLYKPYVDMGGNGTAKRLMAMVNNLPIHPGNYTVSGNKAQKQASNRKECPT